MHGNQKHQSQNNGYSGKGKRELGLRGIWSQCGKMLRFDET